MALIEIDTGVYYDTQYEPDYWYKQSSDCIALGESVMQTEVPTSINNEPCHGGESERMLTATWQKTTATGTFEMSVQRFYLHGPESKGFLARSRHDAVTLTQIS